MSTPGYWRSTPEYWQATSGFPQSTEEHLQRDSEDLQWASEDLQWAAEDLRWTCSNARSTGDDRLSTFFRLHLHSPKVYTMRPSATPGSRKCAGAGSRNEWMSLFDPSFDGSYPATPVGNKRTRVLQQLLDTCDRCRTTCNQTTRGETLGTQLGLAGC